MYDAKRMLTLQVMLSCEPTCHVAVCVRSCCHVNLHVPLPCVSGGCKDEEKPSEQLSCQPECVLPGSECNNTNVCVCGAGYKPEYNRLHVLVACIAMSTNNTATPVPNTVTLPSKDTSCFPPKKISKPG